MVLEYIYRHDIDVLCLQEASGIDWQHELIHEFGFCENHDSKIIYRKIKIGKPKLHLHQQYAKELDFNGDSAFLFTDRDFLIVSGHLKSNKLHLEQAKDMFKTL
jgi:hypothetical protein